MNKNDIKAYIKSQIIGKTPKKQLETLNKLEKFFIDYIKSLKVKIVDKYYECPACHTYFEKNKIKKQQEEKLIKNCLVYTDCGYGDDDKFADRKYRVTFCNCPKCGQRYELTKDCIWQGPLKSR